MTDPRIRLLQLVDGGMLSGLTLTQTDVLVRALSAAQRGEGAINYRNVFISTGSPIGKVYVPNTDPAMCLDDLSSNVFFKTDGLIGASNWTSQTITPTTQFMSLVMSPAAGLWTVSITSPWGIYDGNQDSGHGTPKFIQNTPFTFNFNGSNADYLLSTSQSDTDNYWNGVGTSVNSVFELFDNGIAGRVLIQYRPPSKPLSGNSSFIHLENSAGNFSHLSWVGDPNNYSISFS